MNLKRRGHTICKASRREAVIKVILYTDGGTCRSNPGPMAYGYVGYRPHTGKRKRGQSRHGISLFEHCGMIDNGHRTGTNNEAEYLAVIEALQHCRGIGCTQVHLHVDSQLVCNQILGVFQVKGEGLQRLNRIAKSWIKSFDDFEITHIPREQNQVADRLANVAINLHKYQQECADG